MQTLSHDFYVSFIADDRWQMYLSGLGNTVLIAALATLFGLCLGLLVSIIKYFAKDNKKLRILEIICDIYLTVIRGKPVLIQLMIIYFSVFATMTNGIPAAIIGFSINSGAYIAEIMRSGISAIDKGQSEAGRSLGLSNVQTMHLIILPQAIKNALPALFNEFITLLKETSIAGMIAVPELTKMASNIRGRAFVTMPLYIVAAIYLILVVGMTAIQKNFERRLAVSDKH